MSFPSARITFEVVGENAKPIEGAKVEASFVVPSDVHRSRIISKESVSGGDGRFTAESLTVGEVSFAANKDGYYETTGQFEFRDAKGNRWMPWNPEVQLILRKKINPVKMYARNTRWSGMEIPVVGEPVGFDLMEYAWMPPYGGGKHPDFIFKLDRHYVSDMDFDCTLTITFPGRFDGIQAIKQNLKHGSVFKLPRHAPETGYQTELVKTKEFKPKRYWKSNFEADNNYFFRVRSEEKDGKLVRAMYGKLQGELLFDPRASKTATIFMVYFLNPDYTTNLEYGGNLFENLPIREAVGMREYTH